MNYKRLGDYIIEKVEFNEGNKYDLLQGVSNNKYFQKAKTNTIGVDLSKYRVAHHNQFVFNRATTRNGDKISIALRKGESCIVSPSYRIFEVKDENVLNPDYLLMWFKRPEFDRYARFKSHGSAHEFFDMDEMNDVELPVPSIEKQREIVAQYQAVANKIKVNEQICEKLEATAQTLYKQWFVDFEFPITKESHPELVSGSHPPTYKYSGGAMVYNEELEKEIPEGWEVKKIQDLIDENYIYKNQDGNHGEIHPKSSDFKLTGVPFLMVNNVKNYCADLVNCNFISEKQASKLRIGFAKNNDVLITHKATIGKTVMLYTQYEKVVLTPQITYYRVKDNNKIRPSFIYCLFKSSVFQNQFSAHAEQSTRSYLSILNQRVLELLLPNSKVIIEFDEKVNILLKDIYLYTEINQKLTQLQSLLLSRLATLEG
ncbi:restriction endonuclease subunit S [Empedobacter falsenii]|uniref:Restriction endonuclease subunit S n=1 Tax=Empedobacter falsenii TaxID=343874 RepID=A0AAW7DMT6_9FLAO|nr:restriction endonuclease subunit S [Empedobacter falsenii]MDM1551847.1 restriction endonuclease subunit S [Empedobacter falsenii]